MTGRAWFAVVCVAALSVASVGIASVCEAQVVVEGEGGYGQPAPQQPPPGTVYVQPAEGSQVYVAQPEPQQRVAQTIVHTGPTMELVTPGLIAVIGGWLLHGIVNTYIMENGCPDTDVIFVYPDCPYRMADWVGLSWIPIAGPWLALTLPQRTGSDASYAVWNVLNGVVQGAGAVMVVLGFVIQQEWEEIIYVELGDQPGAPRLAFDVLGAPGGTGVSATLTF